MNKKKNNISITHPHLAKEWDYEKNKNLKPEEFTQGSVLNAWWLCKNGHSYQARIYSRVKGSGCPYCSNQKVLVGFNDLETFYPEIVKEWHPTFNNGLKPTDFVAKSNKKVWWICEHGHEYEMSIYRKINGQQCPVCNNKRILVGANDLATTHPYLIAEWNQIKNDNLKPTDVVAGSNKKVWWKCPLGHEYERTIVDKTSKDGKCPICTNRKVLSGFNDLATTHPELSKQWHPTKNKNFSPTEFTFGSDRKVWWQCEFGHEWEATIGSRVRGNGCPYCSQNGTSRPELILLFYIKKYSKYEVIHRYNNEFELDIFIPDLSIGIEYDGFYFHKDVEKDLDKNKRCFDKNIKLIRVREKTLTPLDDYSIDFLYTPNNNADFSKTIHDVIKEIFDLDVEIDITKDTEKHNEMINTIKKQNSIITTHPNLAKEWNYEKNGKLLPEHITQGSSIKVWWKCENGHEWKATTSSRVRGNGCPTCCGKIILKGYNDLCTTHPEFAKEWHPMKNYPLFPSDVGKGSHKNVWWLGECGHEWQEEIHNRTAHKYGCPICSGKQILIGYNDLATTHPELLNSWNFDKNGNLKPTDVSAGSNKEVWWKCKQGHEYKMKVSSRTRGRGCSICAGKKIIVGINDLATLYPHLAEEWHPTKNANLKPTDVTTGSGKRVWWLCKKCGHEWYTKIHHRTNGSGCPKCKK